MHYLLAKTMVWHFAVTVFGVSLIVLHFIIAQLHDCC